MPKRAISVTEKEIRLPFGIVKTVESGRYEPESRSAPHYHSNLQLYFVTGGKGSLQFSLRRCFVYPGDVVLINANELHTEYSSQSKPLEYLALELDLLEILPKTGNEQGFLQIHREDFEELLSLLRIIQTELDQRQANSTSLCNHLAACILLRLLREDSFTLLQPQRSEKNCQLVYNYITDHFAEKIDLDSLAALAGLNKFHLAHAFKELYGCSINSYLQECRIREATRLLSETKIGITEISRLVGFNTPCHFNSIFRERMKTTPLAYRKANRK